MGTWSISPSSDIASINSSTGEARFDNHTSDVTYTISYNDSTCGTITKSFTVHKCGTPSTCTCDDLTVNGKTIDAAGGSDKTVATYTANCVSNIGASANEDWVTITSTSGGIIKATVGAYTDTTQNRTATITITGTSDNGNCSKPATLTQKKQGGGTCGCPTSISSNLSFLRIGGTKATTYSPSDACFVVDSKPDWISNVSIGGGNISVTAITNDDVYRNDYIKFKDNDGNSCTPQLGVAQNGGKINKTISLVIQTTQPKIYMSSIDATISLQPKTPGVGSPVTLATTGWLNEPNCTQWTNNWTQNITLSGSYTGEISDYNFQVSFQRRVLKKQKTPTTCDSLSPTDATGTMNGVGTNPVSMNGNIFKVGLTSESNISSNVGILLVTQ